MFRETGKKVVNKKGEKKVITGMSKWAKNKKVLSNVARLKNAGFKTKVDLDGRTVVFFPPVLRVKNPKTSGDKSRYRYYKWMGGSTPYGAIGDQRVYRLGIDGANNYWGVTALYEEFKPRGSRYQWKGGFMFDIDKDGSTGRVQQRPTQSEIISSIENSRKKVGENFIEENIDRDVKDEIQKPADVATLSMSMFDQLNTDSDGTDYIKDGEVIETDKDGKNPEDIINNNKSAETKEIVPRAKDKISKAEGNIATISKEEMKETGIESQIDTSELDKWWYTTDESTKIKKATSMNLSGTGLKDFKMEYERTKEFLSFEEFMNQIKDCM